jgi:hypothetical protein
MDARRSNTAVQSADCEIVATRSLDAPADRYVVIKEYGAIEAR